MEQILDIQPTSSKAPQSARGSKDAQNDFSPHLEAALDKKNSSKVPSREQDSLPKSKAKITEAESAANRENQKNSATESNQAEVVQSNPPEVAEPDQPEINPADDRTALNFSATQISFAATFGPSMETPPDAGRAEQLQAFSNFLFTYLNSEKFTATDVPATAATPLSDVLQSLDKTISQDFSQPEIETIIETALQQHPLSAHNSKAISQIAEQPLLQEQDKILSQLQQIIDSSSETGKVTISQYTNLASSYLTKSNTAHPGYQPNLQHQFMIDADGDTPSASVTVSNYLAPDELNLNAAPDNKQNQDLTGLRLDTKEQFYDAKLGEQNNNQNTSNGSEDKSFLGQFSQQNGSSQSLSNTSANGEQTNTFAQVVGGSQTIETQPTGEAIKPVIPPVHNLAHEHEVLQQLYDKFHINIRKPETHLNIKLHPAELGELKIDLTVKEGSIRANVLAQSQHVQEILDKNMLKLRTVLEDQGYTVDAIIVASESESVGDFDLFDNHLFNRQQDATTIQKSTPKNTTGFQIEDIEQAGADTISGVNVTA